MAATLVTSGTPTDPPTDPTDPPGGSWAAGTFYNAGDRVTYGAGAHRRAEVPGPERIRSGHLRFVMPEREPSAARGAADGARSSLDVYGSR
ncbi:hypothetical protein [Streptomyces sp. NBC_01618]|uniref:hypothetical protein n=1 Tax=Streptomyces sp. NBC_01618 TaxID=2975900 RepID=UPI00386EDD45|nr:hypothetical protein OH735_16605 [Streptomyces sp. NBC_01618]